MVKEKLKNLQTAKDVASNKKGEQSSEIWQDERFQHLVTDPRFRSLPKAQRKVKIDKRFQGMFTDNKFKVKYTVDKYGRKVNKSNAEDLRKYYEMDSNSSSEDEEQAEVSEQRKEEKAISRETDDSGESTASDAEPGENDALVSDGEEVTHTLKERLVNPLVDYARGEGRLVTDSSSDDESTDEDADDPELYIDHVWGELDAEAEMTEESTKRLAVCNMDWDRIRAADLMVLLSSFLPPGGSVLSVKIFASQFGKERMAEEDVHGPTELVGLGKEVGNKSKKREQKNANDSDQGEAEDEELVQEQYSDAEEGDDYHMEKLRQYQLNRLRYYYAVIECDSVQTADKVYQECDGIEYESSATRVDLRFIPDDTTFDEEEPTDVCTELPDTSSYKPRQFTTTALQQAKVDLTWDETAVERRELGDKLSSGKLDEINDKELRKIVAYSSEEHSSDDDSDQGEEEHKKDTAENIKTEKVIKKKVKKSKEDVIGKYKALLAEINEKEQKQKNTKYEMEFTWDVSETKDETPEVKEDNKMTNIKKEELTPIEKVLQKRNEKNRKRKEERKKKKLLAKGIENVETHSDSDSDSIPDGIDMNDPYFAEEFANGDFVPSKAEKNADKSKKLKKKQCNNNDEESEQQAKELQLLLDDHDDLADDSKQHFSLEKILKSEQDSKSKRKRRKQLKKSKSSIADERKEPVDNFQMNVKDERFKSLYTSHLFNIDPTDSHFKKTKAMEQLIHEKLKRRADDVEKMEDSSTKRPKKQLENILLVKSLKRKLQMKQIN